MKKVTIIAVLLFCFVQHVHASDNRTPYDQIPPDISTTIPQQSTDCFWQNPHNQNLILVGTLCLFSTLVGMGIQHYKNNNELYLQLEQKKLENAALEKKRDQQKAAFHCIDGIQRLMQEFKSIQTTHPKPEHYNDVQQKQILEMIVAREGSVTTFENKIALYNMQYNKLDPETAQLNQQLLTDLNWLRCMLNTNKLVKAKREQEIEQAFVSAKRQAEVTKVEAEARTAQKHEATAQKNEENARDTKKLVASTKSCIHRMEHQCSTEHAAIKSTLDSGLKDVKNEQATIKSDNREKHEQSIAEIKILKQLIQAMAKEIAEIKQSVQPVYSDTINPPTSDLYPPLHNAPNDNSRPPAFNPDYDPSKPTGTPAH